MQVQTVWESDSNSPRCPRKLKITIFWRHFLAYKSVWQLQKSSFPIKVEFGVDSPEDTINRRRSISVALPNSWPTTRYDQKRFLYTRYTLNKQWWEQVESLRCPAQFCEFRSEIFNSSFNRTFKGIECQPYCFCFVFLQVLVAFVFFGIVRSIIYLSENISYIQGRNSMRRIVHEIHRVQKSSLNS